MSSVDVMQMTHESSRKLAMYDATKNTHILPPSMEKDIMYQRLPTEARSVYFGAAHYKGYKELALSKLKEKLEHSEWGYDLTRRPVLSYLAELQNFVSVFEIKFRNEYDEILDKDTWIQSYCLDLNFVSVVKMQENAPVYAILVDFRRIDAPKWKKDADVHYRASQFSRLAPENVKAIANFVRREIPNPGAISKTTTRTEQALKLPIPIPDPAPGLALTSDSSSSTPLVLVEEKMKKRKRSSSDKHGGDGGDTAEKEERPAKVSRSETPLTADQLLASMGQIGIEGRVKDTEAVVQAYDQYCKDPKSEEGKAFAKAYHTVLESFNAWLSSPTETHGGMHPGGVEIILALYKTARRVSPRKEGRSFVDMIKLDNVPLDASPTGKLTCQFTGQAHHTKHMLKLVLEGGNTSFVVSQKKAGMLSAILGRAFALLEMARQHASLTTAEAKDLKDALLVALHFIRSTLTTATAATVSNQTLLQ